MLNATEAINSEIGPVNWGTVGRSRSVKFELAKVR
jgi:hypothetical protein